MSLRRLLLQVVCCALLLASAWLLAGAARNPSHGPTHGNAADDQAVLKINAECNAAELRGDIAAMDACETDDFTHTHANGEVEHKAEYLQGIGSGAHKFLTLDLSDLHVRTYGSTGIVEGHIHLRADNLVPNSPTSPSAQAPLAGDLRSGQRRTADVNNELMTVWVKQQGKWREAAWFAVGLPQTRLAASESK